MKSREDMVDANNKLTEGKTAKDKDGATASNKEATSAPVPADDKTLTEEICLQRIGKFAPETLQAINNTDEANATLRKIALASISSSVMGRSAPHLHPVILQIQEEWANPRIDEKLKQAELNFLLISESIRSSGDLEDAKDRALSLHVRNSFNRNVIRYNILFVLLLIAALAGAAIYLSKETLALVSAAIGGAITHLLAERTAVRTAVNAEQQESKGGGCRYNPKD